MMNHSSYCWVIRGISILLGVLPICPQCAFIYEGLAILFSFCPSIHIFLHTVEDHVWDATEYEH